MAKNKRNRIQQDQVVMITTTMWGLEYGTHGVVHAVSPDCQTATVVINDVAYTLPTSKLEVSNG